jgi:hypothetical protein
MRGPLPKCNFMLVKCANCRRHLRLDGEIRLNSLKSIKRKSQDNSRKVESRKPVAKAIFFLYICNISYKPKQAMPQCLLQDVRNQVLVILPRNADAD